MIESLFILPVYRMKSTKAFESRFVASLIATFVGMAMITGPISGQDAPKIVGKARVGRLLVLANERPLDDPVEGRLRGFFSSELGSNEWSQIGDTDLLDGVLSPEARFLAAGRSAGAGPQKVGVWVYDLVGGASARRVFDRPYFSCSWAENGRQLFVCAPAGASKFETYRINADGSEKSKLPIPASEVVMDCSPDGAWIASFDSSKLRERRARINVMRPDGTESHAIVDEPGVARDFRFSPDGRKLAYSLSTGERRQVVTTLWIVDRDGENGTKVPLAMEPGTTARPFWSPDGTRLAVGLSTVGVRGGDRIVLVALDGKNPEALPPPPSGGKLFDWR